MYLVNPRFVRVTWEIMKNVHGALAVYRKPSQPLQWSAVTCPVPFFPMIKNWQIFSRHGWQSSESSLVKNVRHNKKYILKILLHIICYSLIITPRCNSKRNNFSCFPSHWTLSLVRIFILFNLVLYLCCQCHTETYLRSSDNFKINLKIKVVFHIFKL